MPSGKFLSAKVPGGIIKGTFDVEVMMGIASTGTVVPRVTAPVDAALKNSTQDCVVVPLKRVKPYTLPCADLIRESAPVALMMEVLHDPVLVTATAAVSGR